MTTPSASSPGPRRWLTACVLGGATLISLDGAIATLALPTLSHDFAVSEGATVWVINAYQLGTAACLLPAAGLAERIGAKRLYLLGLLIFTVASLACALAPSLPALVAARTVQGMGAACLATLGPALIRSFFPRERIAQGLALVAMVVAVSGAAGPSLGALILSVADWPWLFLVNLPIASLAFLVFWRLAPPSQAGQRPFDAVGAGLAALALGGLVTGVDALGREGLLLSLGLLGLALAAGVALVWQQRHRPDPLLPLDLLALPLFSLSVLTSIATYAAQILAYVALPFLFQSELGRSALATGALVTPWPVMVILAAPLAGRLSARLPAWILSSLGLSILALGLALLALLPPAPSDLDVVWRMALCGLGFGFFQTPNNATLMTAGPTRRAAAAGSMLAVARVSGWCLGSALVAVLLARGGSSAAPTCLGLAAALATLAALLSLSRRATK
ncbi:MFS transporter [Pararhodospirillum photometricum]|nr:MFS transporter [Pararhodospirillum photometricum]